MIMKNLMITEDIERYLKDTAGKAKSEAAIIREAIWASREYIEWELNREDENEKKERA